MKALFKYRQRLSRENRAWIKVWGILIILIAIPIIEVTNSMGIYALIQVTLCPITIPIYFIYCEKFVKEYENKKFRIPPLIFLGLVFIYLVCHYSNPIAYPIFGDYFYW